jgi:hypothetical protein
VKIYFTNERLPERLSPDRKLPREQRSLTLREGSPEEESSTGANFIALDYACQLTRENKGTFERTGKGQEAELSIKRGKHHSISILLRDAD